MNIRRLRVPLPDPVKCDGTATMSAVWMSEAELTVTIDNATNRKILKTFIAFIFSHPKFILFSGSEGGVAGYKRGILILIMSTKPTRSFPFLITLTLLRLIFLIGPESRPIPYSPILPQPSGRCQVFI